MLRIIRSQVFWSVLICAIVGVAVLAYVEGRITSGMASYRLTGRSTAVESRSGWALGFKTVYLHSGQEFVVSYETEIKRGSSLRFYVDRGRYGLTTGSVGAPTVTASGSGQFTAPITADGWYRLSISGKGNADGCDIEYSASWWATSPR